MGVAVILPATQPPSLLLSAPTRTPCRCALNFLPSSVFSKPIRPSFLLLLAACRSRLASASFALLPAVPFRDELAAVVFIRSACSLTFSFFFRKASASRPRPANFSAAADSNPSRVPAK